MTRGRVGGSGIRHPASGIWYLLKSWTLAAKPRTGYHAGSLRRGAKGSVHD